MILARPLPFLSCVFLPCCATFYKGVCQLLHFLRKKPSVQSTFLQGVFPNYRIKTVLLSKVGTLIQVAIIYLNNLRLSPCLIGHLSQRRERLHFQHDCLASNLASCCPSCCRSLKFSPSPRIAHTPRENVEEVAHSRKLAQIHLKLLRCVNYLQC